MTLFTSFCRKIYPLYTLYRWLLTPIWIIFFNRKQFLYANPSDGVEIVTSGYPKPSDNHLRIVCISDIHGMWRTLTGTITKGDILIVAGDIVSISAKPELEQLKEFNEWLGTTPFRHKIVIGGNHDNHLYEIGKKHAAKLLSNATYLEDASTVVEGLLIYGCPYSVKGGSSYKAFTYNRHSEELKAKWELIPEEVDILITHGPPKGFLDSERGCEDLTDVVMEKKPRFHVFGHIHKGYGVSTHKHGPKQQTTFINAAYLNQLYLPFRLPVVFDIERRSCGKLGEFLF